MTTHKTRMPGEWEPHSATWLAWPYGDESFGERVPAVEKVYVQIIHALSKNERVKLLVRPEQKAEIEVKLSGAEK